LRVLGGREVTRGGDNNTYKNTKAITKPKLRADR